jgi:tyrosyl-tRNA synthetase
MAVAGSSSTPSVANTAASIQLTAEQEAKYERITRKLQEVTTAEVVRKVLGEGEVVRGYWG